VSTRGLGRWDDAWDKLPEPADRFLDALAALLEAGKPETRERIGRAADVLVGA